MPDAVKRLVTAGHEVVVERGAGQAAYFPDEHYVAAGATMAPSAAETIAGADLVLKVQRPTEAELAAFRPGTGLVAFLQPSAAGDALDRLAAQRVSAFAMELVPRTTKAQSMDALSSQATVAGYLAVLLAATHMGKLLPMLTTAAGTLAPAKAFVLGAGVAGLQAIATARRLGAIVSAFDVRPVVKEQVQSLGASFVEVPAIGQEAEGAGGYAREVGEEQQRRILETVGRVLPDIDLVITTAQIPGKPAPRLITGEMVRTMRPGSAIVDLAAETGGNCELTRAGETIEVDGVTVMGPLNLPSRLPLHASQMYSKNVSTFVEYVVRDGKLAIDLDDPITGPMCVTHDGTVRLRR